MKFRKLRIAWSVFWGVACILLIVLWVRSYYAEDILNAQFPTRTFSSWSFRGKTVVTTATYPGPFKVNITSFPADHPIVGTSHPNNEIGLGFAGVSYHGGFFITIPLWFPVLVSMVLAALSWLSRSCFSLRTLLIATTLVAVGLGIVVYATR
jgi:hypothetical protein